MKTDGAAEAAPAPAEDDDAAEVVTNQAQRQCKRF